MLFKKKVPKKFEFAIRTLFIIIFFMVIIFGVTFVYVNYTQKIKPTSDYEKENDMKIIDVGPKVKNYYKKKFSLSDGLKDFSGTQTRVTTTVTDENNKTKNVTFDMNVYENEKNKRIVMKNNGYDITYENDIRLMDDYLYVLSSVSNKTHHKKAYAACKNDDAIDLSTFTSAYNIVSFLKTEKSKYSIIYNCRTQKNGIDYDDLTIYFKKYNVSFQILVNAKTLRVTYIITPLLSENDITTVIYTKNNVVNFTNDDVKNTPAYDKNHKKQDLPNQTKGSVIKSKTMLNVLSNISMLSTYGCIYTKGSE